MIARRGLLLGLGIMLAAPAVIRTPHLLMPVRAQLDPDLWPQGGWQLERLHALSEGLVEPVPGVFARPMNLKTGRRYNVTEADCVEMGVECRMHTRLFIEGYPEQAKARFRAYLDNWRPSV